MGTEVFPMAFRKRWWMVRKKINYLRVAKLSCKKISLSLKPFKKSLTLLSRIMVLVKAL